MIQKKQLQKRMSRKKNVYKIFHLLLLLSVILWTGACVEPFANTDSPKLYRIGFLSGVKTFDGVFEGFQEQMAELGYIEGENIAYDFQSADGDREKMIAIAEQFVADEVDLILTTTTGAAQVTKAATLAGTTQNPIPVVFTIVSSPVDSGIVEDLRQPNGNITGATRSLKGLISKRVVFLHEMMPDLKTIWVPYKDGYANSGLTLGAIHDVADNLSISIIESPVESAEDLQAEIERFSALDSLDIEAIAISPDPTIQSEENMAALMDFATKQNIAIIANTLDQVRDGGLITYTDDNLQSGRLAALQAERIFQGAEPGVLPVAFVEPNLYLNYKTAQILGVTIDESLLAQASEVIR